MAAKPPLRVVAAGEKRRRKPQTVLEAAESGDFRAELFALRRRIATAVSDPATPARDLAALTLRQIQISKEIRTLDGDGGDEVAEAAAVPDEEWAAT